MEKTILRLWRKLSVSRKKQFMLVALLMLLSGIAEVVSLSAFIPFLAALADPQKILSSPIFGQSLKTLKCLGLKTDPSFSVIYDTRLLMAILAGLFTVAALGAGVIRLLLLWVGVQFANGTGADLSLEVYKRALHQPYPIHVKRNSSQIISNITSKIGAVVNLFGGILTIGTSFVLIIFIIATIFIISPQVALVATLCLGLSYSLIAFVFKKRLFQNSFQISKESVQVVKALQEGLGGIRDILLDGNQYVFCQIYQKADAPLRLALASNSFISQSPRFIMEALGLALFAMLALALSQQPKGLEVAIPTLGALALGAQRVLPALQQGYAAWSGILGLKVVTDDVLDFLDHPIPKLTSACFTRKLSFKKSICFESVSFRYEAQSPWILENLSFEIQEGSCVGIVGTTGSGKSTCLDLLMGLLVPNKGRILVDGKALNERNIRSWQKNIAHVPQSIFLSDSSFAENIAFGVPYTEIDMRKVKTSAQQARISDIIEASPEGYQTIVGERGVRLSGGQRQRLGIARALYKKSKILILDEATNALDKKTEHDVLESIKTFSRLTIIIISHRKSTLRGCRSIIKVNKPLSTN